MTGLFKTVEVDLTPLKFFELVDKIEEPWWLVETMAVGTHRRVFAVVIDGTTSEHEIVLKADGTWMARSSLTV